MNKNKENKKESIVDKNFNAIGKIIENYQIKDSGQRRDFGTGAVRDCASGKGRFDLVPMRPITAIAIHYEKGCLKYGDRNWEKGIPLHSFLDSAMRHLVKVMDGQNDENHAVACLWNMICYYETLLRIQEGTLPKELDDMPKKTVLLNPFEKAQ